MNTKIMPVTDLRRKTREVIDGVNEQQHIVYITQHGRPSVAIIDYELSQLMLAALQEQQARTNDALVKQEKAIALLQSWIDEGDAEEQKSMGEALIKRLDENRTSYRDDSPR